MKEKTLEEIYSIWVGGRAESNQFYETMIKGNTDIWNEAIKKYPEPSKKRLELLNDYYNAVLDYEKYVMALLNSICSLILFYQENAPGELREYINAVGKLYQLEQDGIRESHRKLPDRYGTLFKSIAESQYTEEELMKIEDERDSKSIKDSIVEIKKDKTKTDDQKSMMIGLLSWDTPPRTKNCIHCRQVIKSDVSVCRFCGKDQP